MHAKIWQPTHWHNKQQYMYAQQSILQAFPSPGLWLLILARRHVNWHANTISRHIFVSYKIRAIADYLVIN